MHTSDFDFNLPPELIAQFPAQVRHESRLLHLSQGGQMRDRQFIDLPALLQAGDLLVANDTRVIKARLLGHKLSSGGRVEALIERITGSNEALAQLRASKAFRDGARLAFDAPEHAGWVGSRVQTGLTQVFAQVVSRDGEFYRLRFDEPVLAMLDRIGQVPLPPYITPKPADAPEPNRVRHDDQVRYQTVYATHPGSVAAPTAGLHFDETVFAALDARGIERCFVTLHVGAGTFKPVRDEDLSKHQMHFEQYEVSDATAKAVNAAKAAGRRVIAVGTTSARTLESAADSSGQLQAGRAQTDLFITPGYRFKVVDALVTNFHLPRSTLLMLVSALAGLEPIRQAYAHAIVQRYRFFSYGDAMFIEPPQPLRAQSA